MALTDLCLDLIVPPHSPFHSNCSSKSFFQPDSAYSRCQMRTHKWYRYHQTCSQADSHDPGLMRSLLHYNFVILSYLKDGEGAMTWKNKINDSLLIKGSYAVNVLLGSQTLPFSTALASCPGVIYSAVTWWSLYHGRELNKNAIKEDKINLLTVLFNKNSWRMGRQAHKQCTSSARSWWEARWVLGRDRDYSSTAP